MTLGIPRLREILMTASKKIALPVMTLPLYAHCGKKQADALAMRLSRITLAQVLHTYRGFHLFSLFSFIYIQNNIHKSSHSKIVKFSPQDMTLNRLGEAAHVLHHPAPV